MLELRHQGDDALFRFACITGMFAAGRNDNSRDEGRLDKKGKNKNELI